MMHPPLSVIVPTFNRPDGVLAAVRSLYNQTLVANGFTLIVVDNAPDASAAGAIAALRASCPAGVHLITLHEPQAGVANARNAAMSAVTTKLVAFLDDDQTAPDTWLEALLASHARYPAAVTFGPVAVVLPDTARRHRAYLAGFFARLPGHASGYISAAYGCGNALLDLSRLPGCGPWFDPAMNEVGGEDDQLFARVRRAGGQFAWAADAPVFEHPPHERAQLRYTLRRAFAYGQGPVTLAMMATPPRYLAALGWMLAGVGKTLWHGALWLLLSLLVQPGRAVQLDRMVRGLAKVFWFVQLQFYGAASLGRPTGCPRAILRPTPQGRGVRASQGPSA